MGFIKLPPTAKVMENQNFKCVYLGTMILCLKTYWKTRQIYNSVIIFILCLVNTPIEMFALVMFCICACVFVFDRERKREIEGERGRECMCVLCVF